VAVRGLVLYPSSTPPPLGISRPASPSRPSARPSSLFIKWTTYFFIPFVTLILLQPHFPETFLRFASHSHNTTDAFPRFYHTQLPSRFPTTSSHVLIPLFYVLRLYISLPFFFFGLSPHLGVLVLVLWSLSLCALDRCICVDSRKRPVYYLSSVSPSPSTCAWSTGHTRGR